MLALRSHEVHRVTERKPQIVRVSDDAPSHYAGQAAEVIEKKQRRKGPKTTIPRFDYRLKFRDGASMWFWDTEIIL